MRETFRIYLSGSVKKGKDDPRATGEFWTEEDELTIRNLIGGDLLLLNPSKSDIRRNNYFINYGCDLYLVGNSDVVLVDLRTEKGIGVGAEMMFAHQQGVPVVAWLPPNSHYRRDLVEDVFGEDLSHWIHPFAFGLSDYIVDTLPDACAVIGSIRSNGGDKDASKGIERALETFVAEYPALRLDEPKRSAGAR